MCHRLHWTDGNWSRQVSTEIKDSLLAPAVVISKKVRRELSMTHDSPHNATVAKHACMARHVHVCVTATLCSTVSSQGFIYRGRTGGSCRILSEVRTVAKYYLSHARNTPTKYTHAVTYIRYKTDLSNSGNSDVTNRDYRLVVILHIYW